MFDFDIAGAKKFIETKRSDDLSSYDKNDLMRDREILGNYKSKFLKLSASPNDPRSQEFKNYAEEAGVQFARLGKKLKSLSNQ